MADQVAKNRKQNATVLYVYGVTGARKKPLAVPSVGVDGTAVVQPVQLRELVYWVSPVDALEYGRNLQTNMEKLEWLADASVRHQQVVAALAEQTEVLPARFGTVFNSEDSLIEDLKRRKRSINATLKRVAGAEEWGVKIFADPEATPISMEAKSGKEYLQRKAAVLHQRRESKADPDIAKLQAALKKVSVGVAPLGKVSGGQRNLQWQASFLIRRSNRAKFNSVLRQFASKKTDKKVECTGPWPPYSFVSGDGR